MLPEKCVSSWLRWNPEWTIQSGVHQLIGGGTILAVAGNATGCTTGAATTSGSGFGANKWSLRASLANLDAPSYKKISLGIKNCIKDFVFPVL